MVDIKKKLLSVLMALSIVLMGVGVHDIAKPQLSALGTREGAVGDFQQNISLSGNINPYLNQKANKQLQVVKPPLRGSVLLSQAKEGCRKTGTCGNDLREPDSDKGSTAKEGCQKTGTCGDDLREPDSDKGSTKPDSDKGLRQG